MQTLKKTLITGGGSGGHISVASGLIQALKNKDYELYRNLVYVGGDLGMVGEKYGNSLEQRRFKDADFKTRYIRAGKLQRHLSLSTIKLFFRTILGLFDSLKILKGEKPDLIFSSGGFVSVPVCIAGWMKGIPIYLHEQTATAGLANRIIGKFAKRIYLAFDSSKKYFNKNKTLLVGNIVRDSITKFNKERVSEEIKSLILNNDNYPLIYISGGGLGSHLLNTKILDEIDTISSKYKVILQTGNNQEFKDYEKALKEREVLDDDKRSRFLPIKFIDDNSIGYVYHNMDLFLGRAGANTVYEIGVLTKPSIFIPIPWVTNNEQYENAKVLKDLGLAEIVEEKELKNLTLAEEIEKNIKKLPKESLNYSLLKDKFPTNAVEKVLNDMYT